MNITLVSTWRIVNAMGGAERVFCDLSNALAERGHKVTSICFDYAKGTPAFPLDGRVKFINSGEGKKPDFLHTRLARNVRSFSFDSGKRRDRRTSLIEEFKGKYLIPAIQNSAPDIIIIFQPETVHLVKDFGKLSAPVVVMVHSATKFFLPNNQPPCIRASLRETTAIQVLMPRYIDEVKKVLPDANVVCIPNAVPLIKSTANRSAHTIINVGRLVYLKRQELLVEAFSLIANKYPDWSVKIFGDGDEDPKRAHDLQQLIDSRGLSNRILLCGASEKVLSELEKSSIFAFPSRSEGFSMSLTEAMATGLPTVGCKTCTCVNELVRDGVNGFLCDETPQDFARGLSLLMDSEALRIQFGNVAKKDMLSYAPDAVWEMWEKLLASIVKRS